MSGFNDAMTIKRRKRKPMSLAERLREARLACKLTQREAASRANVTPVYLCYIEHGRNEPPIRTLRRIAKVYNVPVSKLLEE
jgi:transcriptional regulator with XRE-family HTH domain